MDAMQLLGQEITMKTKILILFANTYDMLDEKQQQRTGCSVHYLFWGEHGEQLFANSSQWDVMQPVGVQRAKCSISMQMRAKIPFAPAIYEAEFKMAVGSDGKPVAKLQDVAYFSHLDAKEKVIPGMVVPGMVEHPASEAPAPEPSSLGAPVEPSAKAKK